MVRLILSIDRREGETAARQTVDLAAELQVCLIEGGVRNCFTNPIALLRYLAFSLTPIHAFERTARQNAHLCTICNLNHSGSRVLADEH